MKKQNHSISIDENELSRSIRVVSDWKDFSFPFAIDAVALGKRERENDASVTGEEESICPTIGESQLLLKLMVESGLFSMLSSEKSQFVF